MRAIQVHAYGGSDRIALGMVPLPTPKPGEVRVELMVAGVNFIDVYMREGQYRNSKTYGTPLPFTLGMEGAGVVTETHRSGDCQEGDRVAWCLSRGSYAEAACVPAWKLVKLPPDIDFDTGTTLMLQGCTAHYLSHSVVPLEPGQWSLVHAGAGGVGQILIQLLVRKGLRVITTVGSPEKARIASALGAEHTLLYRDIDFLPAVVDITEGNGVQVVYDAVGAETIDRSIRCLRSRGTIVNYGGASGLVKSIRPLALAEAGSVFFTRPHLAHYLADRAEIAWRTNDLFEAVRQGDLILSTDRRFPLESAGEAMDYLESRQSRGKLLLDLPSSQSA